MPDDTKITCEICGKVLSTRGLNGHRQSKQCQDIAARKSKKSKFVEEPNEKHVEQIHETKPAGVAPNGPDKKEQIDKEQKNDDGEWDGEFF